MAQIPIFGGSQRIEAANPVAIGSGENARMQGEASAQVGKAMYDVGNALDAVNRRAKEQLDKYAVAAAVYKARFHMMDQKAKQDARALQPGDRDDGFDAVKRFREDTEPGLEAIADGLQNPRLQQAFYMNIAPDMVESGEKLLAGEVKKRAETIPVLRQDSLMAKAAIVRADPSKLEEMMMVQELETLDDKLLPENQKPIQVLADKKALAKEVINGFLDRSEKGARGDQGEWHKAREVLTQKLGQIFTPDELDKEMQAINQSEYSWYQRKHMYNEWAILEDKRAAEKKSLQAQTMYSGLLEQAGNSDLKRGPILAQIENDPRFDAFPEVKKRLIENRTFMEVKDDKYEVDVISKAIRSKNYGALISKVVADQGKTVSLDRATRLLRSLENMQQSGRTDPALLKLIDQGKDEIESYSKSATFDFVSGMNKQENDTSNEYLQTQYMTSISYLSEQGKLNTANVRATIDRITKKTPTGGRTIIENVRGVAPHQMATTEGISQVREQIARDLKSGKIKTPEERRAAMEKLRGLKKNENYAKEKESFQGKSAPPSKNTKVFDE